MVLDENYIEINRVNYKLTDGTLVGADSHDSIYIDDGHHILVTYQDKKVDNMPEELGYGSKITVSNCLIQEIKNGEILWQNENIIYTKMIQHYSKQ